MNWAQVERQALCNLLETLPPEHPTLCTGWTVADLAAHLVTRESRPDAAIGIVSSRFAPHLESVMDQFKALPWQELVNRVRLGPPRWNPMAIPTIDGLANTVEFFVHHEDVRRALPEWKPRSLDPAFERILWRRLGQGARLLWRKAKVGVTLHNGEEHIVAKDIEQHHRVVVAGTTSELLLASYGRRECIIEVSGDEADIEIFNQTPLGV